MKLQNVSLPMMSNNYTHVGKDAKAVNKAHVGNTGKNNKTGSPNAVNASLSVNSQFDKMIESIQEQIQRIQGNDRYDADTKKSKIEELEKQLEEIEKAKTEQLNQSVLRQHKKSESNNSGSSANSNAKDKSGNGGAILDISINAKALLEADNSLKSLKSAHSLKVKLEGESNVLASEIKIDKERGVDTTHKEEELAQIKEGVENSFENIGKAIKDVKTIEPKEYEPSSSLKLDEAFFSQEAEAFLVNP